MKNLLAQLDFSNVTNPATNFPITRNPVQDEVNAGSNIGGVVSSFLSVGFMVAGMLLLIWLSWGVFQYIFAEGKKENLQKARSRITWAIIGFIITLLAYVVSDYAREIILGKPL